MAPTFSPAGGTYSVAQTVTLSSATAGVILRYTTDGSTPSDTAGTLYAGPITVNATTTIKAIAYASGLSNSTVSTATYTITTAVAAPTFNPPGGTYTGTQRVTLSTTTPGASIYYTDDGSTPTDTEGRLYTEPLTVVGNVTIKAIAYGSGLSTSAVSTATYTIRAAAPLIIPAGGTYTSAQTVRLSAEASIRYTTDGSTPSDTVGTEYAGPFTVSQTTTVKAIAYATGLTENSLVTTAVYTIVAPPTISSVSPTTVAPGAQITIFGSGFGSALGSGSVWLGSTLGTVVSWSDTQVVATVALNAKSGTAQVRQSGVWSNAVAFTVNTVTISSVSPASGVSGTPVTITGSGFGAAQGNGQVWLGSAAGVVQTWSDTQVVAQVAPGSTSGKAQVLQNGVWSDPVPFTVNTLRIASVSPVSGGPGTSVTITGTAFGSSQGSGTVLLGSTAGQVVSWSDAQVVAAVAPTALTGIVRVQQNGVWSNAVPFKVTGGNGVTLVPNLLNMMVGDTRTIQALSATGQPVTGLTWASSDPNVVSLSSDDPPILTALAPGHVTITAGDASADVTVSAGALPPGTVLWSNPVAGVTKIVPAVPSPSGVADVFAFQGNDTVYAITSDGATAWTADISQAESVVPGFQGGLIAVEWNNYIRSIVKYDGITGQRSILYTDGTSYLGSSHVGVHTDGTLFALGYLSGVPGVSQDQHILIGIDSITGGQKFSVPLDVTANEATHVWGWEDPARDLIIAGDGYAYVPYEYFDAGPSEIYSAEHLKLLRVNSDGAHDYIHVRDWIAPRYGNWDNPSAWNLRMITNADKGILLSWESVEADEKFVDLMAKTTGASASLINSPPVPGQCANVVPVLQAQDGSFVGAVSTGEYCDSQTVIGFDATGAVRWSVGGNYRPQIATADGGLIATTEDGSAVVFDQSGSATGQIANLPTQSWTGNEYASFGSLASISMPPVFPDGASFWPQAGGNPSGNGTAFVQCPCLLQSAGEAPMRASASTGNPAVANRTGFQSPAADAPLKSYVILEGDPGLNLPGHVPHNVGGLFHLGAGTEQDALNAQGNLAGSPKRVSSVQDFAAQLTANGPITGGVVYLGHGAQQRYADGTRSSVLAPGEQAGPDTNVSAENVNLLSNAQMDTGATITLHACYAGFGSGRYSIAQLIANRLQRRVYAPTAGTFFTVDPNSHRNGMTTPKLPDNVSKPVYLLQDNGVPFSTFLPSLYH